MVGKTLADADEVDDNDDHSRCSDTDLPLFERELTIHHIDLVEVARGKNLRIFHVFFSPF